MVVKAKRASVAAAEAVQKIREGSKRDSSPKWDGSETWSGEQFTAHYHNAMQYYNLNASSKELKPRVIDWMGRNGYSKETITAFKNTKDSRCGLTIGSIAACLLKGMPAVHPGFNKGRDTTAWLRNQIDRVITAGAEDYEPVEENKVTKSAIPVPSIQDRIRDQAIQISEEIEGAIDSFITDPDAFDPKAFRVASLLRTKGTKAAQARYVRGFFENGHNELIELSSGQADDQLREAYRHISRKNIKKLIEFYESVAQSCEQIAAEAKVLKKPRIKKVKPAEDLVKKLKFKLSDDKLGITSVPPAQLIKAQAAVLYNVKTRKIGYLIAKTSEGLGVKGTTIDNFTEKSTQKTLRKPVEQLKEFKDQSTQKRVETWYNKSVKTTETQHNGRMSEDVVILKVFK
jgi:glycerophosphoryl diester phosphodiesterase